MEEEDLFYVEHLGELAFLIDVPVMGDKMLTNSSIYPTE